MPELKSLLAALAILSAVVPYAHASPASGDPSAALAPTLPSAPYVGCHSSATDGPDCQLGATGTPEDDARTLPLVPSIRRDVHLVDMTPGSQADVDRNMRANGYFTRPHIPPYRTTADGRLAMQSRTRTSNPNSDVFLFYLLEPKRLDRSFLSSDPAPDAGMRLLADRDAFALPRHQFVDTTANGSSLHSALCNDPAKPPRTCANNPQRDCYELTVITPFHNEDAGHLEIWGTTITIEVRDPKTSSAAIADIHTQTPRRGAIWPGVTRLLETMITSDGRLMAGRLSGATITYVGADGQTISDSYDSAYSAYGPSLPACDPNHFVRPYPISHMSYDPVVKANWDVAAYPWTYPDGIRIPDGADLRATYPWLDSKGKNIFFGTSSAFEPLHTSGRFEVRCLDGVNCDLSGADESTDGTRAVTVVGLWTQGRAVLIDNLLNNVDWGVGKRPTRQRLARLYDDENGWVRVGSGRENAGDTVLVNIRGASGNINFIDSIENKLNHDEHLKLNVPFDVAWLMSNGTVTDVVAFDDWVNPNYLISSQMVQAKSGASFGPDFRRVQNAASGLFRTPGSGAIAGPGRVERVALGGARGKGLFLRPSARLEYQIPADQPAEFAHTDWYLGLFVDPRMKNDIRYRRLVDLPDGSAIDLKGRQAISFVDPNGARHNVVLDRALPFATYTHLGFRASAAGARVEVYRDGVPVIDWHHPLGVASLRLSPGTLRIGGTVADGDPATGFHGWIDDFVVIGNADALGPEELCNKALGSTVALSTESRLLPIARRHLAAYHAQIKARTGSQADNFHCLTEVRSKDGWLDLNALPSDVTSVREALLFPEGPLRFNHVRPDSTQNAFCLSCHVDDATDQRPASLRLDALTLRSVLLQNDPRRQPLQPPARVHGKLPAGTWGGRPLMDLYVDAPAGHPIDEFVAPE